MQVQQCCTIPKESFNANKQFIRFTIESNLYPQTISRAVAMVITGLRTTIYIHISAYYAVYIIFASHSLILRILITHLLRLIEHSPRGSLHPAVIIVCLPSDTVISDIRLLPHVQSSTIKYVSPTVIFHHYREPRSALIRVNRFKHATAIWAKLNNC